VLRGALRDAFCHGKPGAILFLMSDSILSLAAPPADARVVYGSDPNQFFDLRLPKDDLTKNDRTKREKRFKSGYPLVIGIHGGYWRAEYNLDHLGHLCAALTAKGLATANLEYRRVGNEGGAWPNTFADIRGAYNFLLQHASEHDLDPQKFLIIGHSAGGQLALCLAGHEPGVTRVVSLAGVVDLQRAYQLHLSNDAVVEFLRGTPSQVPDHYREADPMQLAIPRARQWMIHGSADDIVPPAFSRDYVAAKQKRAGREKEDAHLLEIPLADHFDLIDPRTPAWKQVAPAVLDLVNPL
jgi:acetyl esterase/lipase